jgi:hypothetical protein
VRDKGILFSVMSLMLVLGVFNLAAYYSTIHVREDIHAEKTRNMFSDIETDIEDLLVLEADVYADEGKTIIEFNDHIPLENGNTLISDYKNFIEDYYAGKTNSRLTFKAGSPVFTVKPTEVVYEYNSYNKQEVRIYNQSGQTEVDGFAFYLKFDETPANVTEETTTGSNRIKLNASFPNTGYEETFYISPTEESNITFEFTSGKLVVHAGRNMIHGVERDNSVVLKTVGDTQGFADTRIIFDGMLSAGVKTNMTLQIDGGITRRDVLWLTTPVA